MRRILFFSMFPLLLLTACESSEIEVDPLTALPPHSLMVGVFDYSNENQRDLFDELRGRFPETGLFGKYVVSTIDEDLKDRKLSYKKFVKPFLNGKWKAALSFDFANIEEGVSTLYMAVSSTEPDKLQELFVPVEGVDETGVKPEKDGDYKYWTWENDSFFLVRYKDLFVFTNEAGGFGAVKKRIESGDGLAGDQEFMGRVNSIAGENLGFFYVANDELGSLLKDIYLELGYDVMGDGIVAESLGIYGDNYTVVYADSEGFRVVGESEVIGGVETMEKVIPGYGDELNFAEKVNGEGVFLYGESSVLGSTLSSAIEMMSVQSRLMGAKGFAANETPPDFKALLGPFADALKVFDGGVAMVMADQGGFFPSIGLYFDIDEEDREAVLGMVESLDGYADKLIVQMDVLAQQEDVKVSDFLKRDVELVKGGAVRKISVDLAALPKDVTLGMTVLFGGSLEKQLLELFYGLTGDNVFVLSLASNLEEKYGKNVLADDENFKKAIAEVKPGYTMSYIRMSPLLNLVSRYVGLALLSAGLREEGMDLAAAIQDWFSTIEYAVSSNYFEDGVIKSEAYLKITEPTPKG